MRALGLLAPSCILTLDEWEIQRDRVVPNRKLGEGAFGTVYGGEAFFDEKGWVSTFVSLWGHFYLVHIFPKVQVTHPVISLSHYVIFFVLTAESHFKFHAVEAAFDNKFITYVSHFVVGQLCLRKDVFTLLDYPLFCDTLHTFTCGPSLHWMQ